ncbi:MAG: bifunctional (p)ppGpp synthetase/guanosine-3',5'-bis(diphosphate) 3'-pyrophosphohydrolase [Anaerolineae bacterium]|nr:bifunctional (p)ppGpp synthetase/guanosine-3',5'-bis(diphosphate) 3'-pyrophosphohydrolase [Anaerolineae bacterium]
MAEVAHEGQDRKSGEPYIIHPLNVAHILAELNFEPAVIAAGLLHDVLEDSEITREEIRRQFGEEILVLVEGVTKLERVEKRVQEDSARVRNLQEMESLRKLLMAMANDDVRVIFIKLADRLHNMRTLEYLSPDSQIRMARETLQIFAPLANRLGIWVWKAELEDLSFRYLNAKVYYQLADLLATRRELRNERVQGHAQQLRVALASSGMHAEIKGRTKHIYSIYHKMRRKNVPFAQIYDVEGLRVVVDTEPECYQVLGVVHSLWKPVPGEFDDYVAHPKPNGYQSLHTAVIGEDGASLEIQIRTREMDYFAEYGYAAHWRYKESGVHVNSQLMEQVSSIQQSVKELTSETKDARVFIDSIRLDVFQDRVFAFTPKGRVIDLPVGATPLDFAYYVHTEVGHGCRGARVNGRWTNLDYPLQTGDQVRIILGRKGGPSRDWLNEDLGYVTTSRARQKIRHWFRRQGREENIARGQEVLEKILKRLSLTLSENEVFELFRKRLNSAEEFLAALGMGDLSSDAVVNRLAQHVRERKEDEEEELWPEEAVVPPAPEIETADISIRGTGGVLTHLARCCSPLPGEDIIGYVTRGRGVTVHRRDCSNVLNMTASDRERLIEVAWGTEERTFAVQVTVTAYDRSGLIHDISGILADRKINLSSLSTGKRDRYHILPLYMTLDVPDLKTLAWALAKIEQIPNVIDARRSV